MVGLPYYRDYNHKIDSPSTNFTVQFDSTFIIKMSASEHSTYRCYACDEIGHGASQCPSLGIPPLSFGKGTGGGVHQHDDEEEECIHSNSMWNIEEEHLYLNYNFLHTVESYEGHADTRKYHHKASPGYLRLGKQYLHMPSV